MTEEHFDPYVTLEALESRRVNYVLIGAFARVIQGTEELTRGVDVAPSARGENLGRLTLALEDLDAVGEDGAPVTLDTRAVLDVRGRGGELKIVANPAGTRGGYDDLRRAASREPLGRGLRPLVASIGDLARMAAALGRERDMVPLHQFRILADLDRGRVRGIER